jgi:hypothetical protein
MPDNNNNNIPPVVPDISELATLSTDEFIARTYEEINAYYDAIKYRVTLLMLARRTDFRWYHDQHLINTSTGFNVEAIAATMKNLEASLKTLELTNSAQRVIQAPGEPPADGSTRGGYRPNAGRPRAGRSNSTSRSSQGAQGAPRRGPGRPRRNP